MALKDKKKYDELLDELEKSFGPDKEDDCSVAIDCIKSTLDDIEQCLKKDEDKGHDKDRIEKLHTVIAMYAGAIFEMQQALYLSIDDINKAADVYGQLIDAGMDALFSNLSFASTSMQSNEFILDICSTDGRTDMLFEDYESALKKGLFIRPENFNITFSRRTLCHLTYRL